MEISINKAELRNTRGKKIIMENIVDDNIIGGLKIKIGSFVYDGSIRGYLDRFKSKAIS